MPLPNVKQIARFVANGSGLFWSGDRAKEEQKLLDPCERNDLPRHFSIKQNGILMARTPRAAETILHYSLDRQDLIDARARTLSARFKQLREGIVNQWESFDGTPITGLFDFQAQEFGGLWYLYIRQLANQIAQNYPRRPQLSPNRIQRFYEDFGYEDNAERLLMTASFHLREQEDDDEEAVAKIRKLIPRIQSVEITNFRGIEHLKLQVPSSKNIDAAAAPHAPSVIILGENSTGKSSVLEAIALALSDANAIDDMKITWGDLVLDPTHFGVDLTAPKHGLVVIKDEEGKERRFHVSEEGYRFAPGFSAIPVFAYSAFRQYRDRSRKHSRSRYVRNLFNPDEALSNPEQWLLKLEGESFKGVTRRLRDILSIEGDYDFIEQDRERNQCLVLSKLPGTADVYSKVPLRFVSSGYRAVFSMVCEIMQGLMDDRINPDFESFETARGVVLIDEIEAHLHPKWKISIMSGLRKALPSMTFIATSHDPLCLRGMEQNEVIVLRRSATEEGSTELPMQIELVSPIPDISKFQVDQLLTSDLFDLYSTDDPVIELKLAAAAESLGRGAEDEAQIVLQKLARDVAESLPIGNTSVQQLIQDALAELIAARRGKSQERMQQLSSITKEQIRNLLTRL